MPVRSRLCANAEPQAVVEALLALHPFGSLYVADLDAIQRQRSHFDALKGIRLRFPHLELWVDSGISNEIALDEWADSGIGRAVIGSESLLDAEFMSLARNRCGDPSPVLSLDFIGEEFKGPEALLAEPARYWPQRVLAMNLRRVGSSLGPDVELIATLAAKAPSCEVYAAGGIRSTEDLARVAAAGAAGALIASALHDGRLGCAELAQFA
jgi:phosphoribosylformimino-5-aminoimidazole carboxamide ribotide isomerase